MSRLLLSLVLLVARVAVWPASAQPASAVPSPVHAAASASPAAGAPAAAFYRVFLTDGRVLSSYGEWARLEDRVVLSLPTLSGGDSGDLQLVSIPSDRVDWVRTREYADSVRAAAYAASRGDADFAQLRGEVARAVGELSRVADPGVRLAVAERTRQMVASWPAAHYGYRLAEVREMLGMLDAVIAELRVEVRQTRFDLALTTPLVSPPPPPLPPPGEAEVIEGLATAAALAEEPSERITLLERVVWLLDRAVGVLPADWASRIRRSVLAELAGARRVARAYERLRTESLERARRASGRADVSELRRLRARVVVEDGRLGRRQPGEVAALLATLDAQIDAIERLRLARDRWSSRAPVYRRYRRSMRTVFSTLETVTRRLEDVRAMSGPPVNVLGRTAETLARQERALVRVEAPAELAAGHALIRSAWQLARQAVDLRLRAVRANDIDVARQASSAAAGAVLLYRRGRSDLAEAMARPSAP